METIFHSPANEPAQTPVADPTASSASGSVPFVTHDSVSLFTSYAEKPQGVLFETQQEEEQILLFLRQHFIVNVPWILATLLLLVAPFTILPFFFTLVPLPFVVPAKLILVAIIWWYLATFGYALANFLHWYYNIYIVTTERVIDIDFIQLLYKKFSEARIDRIEDVTYMSSGFFSTIFNYGFVKIQTAGEIPEIQFEMVPKPADIVRVLEGLLEHVGPPHH
jgi:hypothetical protein